MSASQPHVIRVRRQRRKTGELVKSVLPWLFLCRACGERDKAHTQAEALTYGLLHLGECSERGEPPC